MVPRPRPQSTRLPPPWAIQLDFDGTITTFDVAVACCRTWGKPDWERWDDRWRAKEVTLRELLRNQYEAIEASAAQMRALVRQRVHARAGFDSLVAWSIATQVPMVVVSEGIDLLLEETFAKLRIDIGYRTNLAHFVGPTQLSLSFPSTVQGCDVCTADQCGTCKSEVVRTLQSWGYRVAFVGDGEIDLYSATIADAVFATGALVDHCQRAGIGCTAFSDFSEIIPPLQRLRGDGHPPAP